MFEYSQVHYQNKLSFGYINGKFILVGTIKIKRLDTLPK